MRSLDDEKRRYRDQTCRMMARMLSRRLLRRIYSGYLRGLDYEQIALEVYYQSGIRFSEVEIDEVITVINSL